jgi:signal transduction histidine kinase
MLYRWLGLLALCCSLVSPAFGDVANDLAWSAARSTQPLSLEQIEKLPASEWEALPPGGMINRGFTGKSLWLSTRYTPERPGRQVLELTNPQHDRVSLYILRDDAPPEIRLGGFRQPTTAQAFGRSHNQLFDFSMTPGQSARIYLQVESARPLFVWPRLNDGSDFFRTNTSERLWLGLYFGLFVALCLYSLMAWATTRDENYFDYFLFLSLMGLVHGQMLGLWHELFLYDSPRGMDFLSTLLPSLGLAALCRFSRNYLDLAHQSPRLYRLLTQCTWASLLLILPAYGLGGSALSIPLCDVLGLLFSGVGILAGVRLLQRGYRPARHYLLSQLPLVGGGLLYVGANFGLLPANQLTMFGFQLGAGLSTVMIALALAGKVRSLQKEHIQAHNDRLIAEQQIIEVLRESESVLEIRVAERTRQLEEALALQRQQHDDLERSKRSLEALHEERGAFLQIAAHDLKNPTAAIISYADLMRERWHAWDEEKKLKRLGNIRHMAQLTFDIIRKLLDIDAIETGHYALRPTALSAADSLRTVSDDYRERCEAKDLRLNLNLTDDTLKVRADKTAMHQIIDNLVSNAIKYSPHGRSIHISLEQEAGHALIQVRDEGPGISEEDQGKLFRKFTRLSARPTGGEHSTGLGLSIVKHMVEASGGQVGCISRLGEGATFFVCLPLAA